MKLAFAVFLLVISCSSSAQSCSTTYQFVDYRSVVCSWRPTSASRLSAIGQRVGVVRPIQNMCRADTEYILAMYSKVKSTGNKSDSEFLDSMLRDAMAVSREATKHNDQVLSEMAACNAQMINTPPPQSGYNEYFKSTTRGPGSAACQRCEAIRMDGCEKARNATGLATSAGYLSICGHSCANVCE